LARVHITPPFLSAQLPDHAVMRPERAISRMFETERFRTFPPNPSRI
jgi:hypothetical protein